MTHDEYWKMVWDDAHDRLDTMLDDCDCSVADIVGDEHGIDCYHDAKTVLAYCLRCAESCDERACAILSVGCALHALNELNEHLPVA